MSDPGKVDRDRDDAIRIQPFEPGDLDALMEIENSSFTLPWSRESYEEFWPLPSISIWVARRHQELVGYYLLQYIAEEAELHTFAVKPEFRHQGIGTRLLEHMRGEARRHGVRHVFLQVRPSNAEALALYEHQGFVVVGKRRRYYRDNGEDAFVMRLDIV